MKMSDWLSDTCFRWVHQHHLVYNTCWEDPRIDRQALALGPDDTVAVITSAGCNVLDYALLEPRAIHAIDLNYRQNALLDLKIAGIRRLDFETFFALFGAGYHAGCADLYRRLLRPELGPPAQAYWDRHIGYFASRRRSFYFHGTTGWLAWMVNRYIDRDTRTCRWAGRRITISSAARRQAFASLRMFTKVCTCGKTRKHETKPGPSRRQYVHTMK